MNRGRTISRYRVLDRIAEGGMGEVYRAKMETLGGAEKVVALKVVRSDLAKNDEFASLFIDEARLAMGLSHANIVQSFDAGRIDDQLFLAMEYVAGVHLGDLLQACERRFQQPIPHRHLIYIAVESLKGLDYAHRRVDSNDQSLGVVHRDVSPGNILISWEGEVKVADFGIAKSALRSRETTGERVKGKLPYIAPEQLRQSGVDRRTDIYSLGAVMYEALTDRWLVDANDAEEAIPDILRGRFPRPREINPEIPEAVEEIVLRALCTDASARYPSAAAMRQELERYALSDGYLLSSTDLADFLGAIRSRSDDRNERGDLGGPERWSSVSSPNEAVQNGPFNDLLGAELRKIDTADGYSVFTTGEVSGVVGTDELGSANRKPPGRRRRSVSWLLALFGLVTVLSLFGFWARRSNQMEAAVKTPSQAVIPPATERPAAQPEAVQTPSPVMETPAPESPVDEVSDRPSVGPRPPKARRRSRPSKKRAATAAEAAIAAPTPAPAYVSVNSDPWSYVTIDGSRINTTPLRNHRLEPGRHQVILENPEAGLERRFEIEVDPGESKRLSVDLRGTP
ncbi:MAG: protein kinase domain-containing protein [Polyangiales bacterium]